MTVPAPPFPPELIWSPQCALVTPPASWHPAVDRSARILAPVDIPASRSAADSWRRIPCADQALPTRVPRDRRAPQSRGQACSEVAPPAVTVRAAAITSRTDLTLYCLLS